MGRVRVSRVLLTMLLLLLAGCQADVRVDVDVDPDGTGAVTIRTDLDQDAQDVLGDIEGQLQVRDLQRAGWVVTTIESDDGMSLSATKPVVAPDQWQPVLDELAGPDVFSDVELTIEDNRQRLSFDLDVGDGWDLLSDEGVAAALGGEPFGAPIESLTNGRVIDDIIALELQVRVQNFDDEDPTVRTFTPRFDQGPLFVNVEATAENGTAVLLRWIAIALFSLFVVATLLAVTGIVLQRRADRLRPAPTPETLSSRVRGTAAAPAAANSTPASSTPRDTVRLVVVEAVSVLYQQSHFFDASVLLFVRNEGGTARADTIADGFASVLKGSMDTAAFWELCGIDADTAEIDARYVQQRRLHPGAASFLSEMQRRRIPVAATTNDAMAWSMAIRERDRLSGIWPWLVSSEVGATTSNVAMFEVLRRESGTAYAHCLYVDTSITNLDAARELGMKTALFDTGDLDLPAIVGHPIVTDFTSLLGTHS